jgi:hypothetical protein
MRGKRPSSPWLVDLVPIDLRTLVDPERTAVVTCELQRGIMGDPAGGLPLAVECADLRVVAMLELRRRGGTIGCVAMCAGGGMGSALMFELV